jgi:DNA-binding CsgD family transcriptional regulator
MRTDGETSLEEIASELMSGCWVIVSEGTEGRHRWYAATRAPREKARPLSQREREALTRALYGESNKHIAYSLGIGSSAVSTMLRRARRKLRGRIPEDLLASLVSSVRSRSLPTRPPPRSGPRPSW